MTYQKSKERKKVPAIYKRYSTYNLIEPLIIITKQLLSLHREYTTSELNQLNQGDKHFDLYSYALKSN